MQRITIIYMPAVHIDLEKKIEMDINIESQKNSAHTFLLMLSLPLSVTRTKESTTARLRGSWQTFLKKGFTPSSLIK